MDLIVSQAALPINQPGTADRRMNTGPQLKTNWEWPRQYLAYNIFILPARNTHQGSLSNHVHRYQQVA